MNTKRRLSDDLSNDSEILSEKRFVKLYKEELESIEKQIHDLKKLDQKDFDVKSEVEDKARLYYRTFARELRTRRRIKGRTQIDQFSGRRTKTVREGTCACE